MVSDQPSDVLPILNEAHPAFDSALRGYDRAQVDRYIGQLDDDVRAALAERDSTAARSADLAAQLASAQAQIESLRRQLRTANEPVTPDNVDERVRHLLEAAATEAAATRAAAEADAETIRSGAADAAARTRAAATAEAEQIVAEATARHAEADETFKRRLADAEQHRAAVETELATRLQQTRAEEDRLTSEAHAERERLDAEAAAERQRLDAEARAERERLDAESAKERNEAEEDFEITLRARRSTEAEEAARRKHESEEVAARTVAAAQVEAARLIDEATGEVRRLHRHRDEAHAQLRQLQERLATAIAETLSEIPPPSG